MYSDSLAHESDSSFANGLHEAFAKLLDLGFLIITTDGPAKTARFSSHQSGSCAMHVTGTFCCNELLAIVACWKLWLK